MPENRIETLQKRIAICMKQLTMRQQVGEQTADTYLRMVATEQELKRLQITQTSNQNLKK